MKSYRDYALELVPTWLSGPVGELYTQFVGLAEDLSTEAVLQGMKASKVLAATFHVSGLRYIGQERELPRYPSETDDGYQLRLRGAWDAYVQGGTWVAIVEQLATYGVTAEVWVQNELGPLPNHTAGTVWDFDDDSDNWSRFYVVIRSSPWSRDLWSATDGSTWGDGGSWGSTALPGEVDAVRAIINKWRPARMAFPHVMFDVVAHFTGGTIYSSNPETGDRLDLFENRNPAGYLYWDGYGT